MNGLELIAKERQRQIIEKNWTPEHDDGHSDGTLAVVAAVLAVYHTDASVVDVDGDRSDDARGDCWGILNKHKGNEIQCLVIAGALIAAEIDRVARRDAPTPKPNGQCPSCGQSISGGVI